MAGQAVQGFVHFGQAALLQGLAQQALGPEVMPPGVELEHAAPHVEALQLAPRHRGVGGGEVDTCASQHPCQFLHVLLRVGAPGTQRVQLHQLPRQVLVGAVDGVLHVVQVDQHGRVQGGSAQQVPEAPKRMRADGRVLVVAHHGADVGLVLEHAEMVQPEPGHLLLHLARRVQRPQHVARRRFPCQAGEFLLVRLLGGALFVVILQGIGRPALLLQVEHQPGEGLPAQRQGVDLRLCGSGQQGRSGRELLVQHRLEVPPCRSRQGRR